MNKKQIAMIILTNLTTAIIFGIIAFAFIKYNTDSSIDEGSTLYRENVILSRNTDTGSDQVHIFTKDDIQAPDVYSDSEATDGENNSSGLKEFIKDNLSKTDLEINHMSLADKEGDISLVYRYDDKNEYKANLSLSLKEGKLHIDDLDIELPGLHSLFKILKL